MRELDTARQGLAALWGATPGFGRAEGRLDELDSLPALEKLFGVALPRNLRDLRRSATQLAQRQAAVELAEGQRNSQPHRRGRLPPLRGHQRQRLRVRRFCSAVPVFDRDQGAIAEARRHQPAGRQGSRSAPPRCTRGRRLTQARTELATATARSAGPAPDDSARCDPRLRERQRRLPGRPLSLPRRAGCTAHADHQPRAAGARADGLPSGSGARRAAHWRATRP